ncbi:ImpA family type VI secretion system protein [Bradyrhizobium sp. WSM1417]|uniref:type VI secretion system protein TssA n=1 Tax=Bradyrhizobium sp. WSM1417 TaxID=754500 RepID=UPI0004835E0B|nr:type VI secretion system ImpA family N-terminal domain-containing protein [Bradyrhizobium sp. WSM1417]
MLHADQSIVDQNAVGVEPPPLPPSALILDVLASDPVVAALTAPLAGADPCGPDLDAEGDPGYLNFFAQAELILPSSFFSAEDGKPFDRTTVDLKGQRELIKPLLQRTRDIRLLILQARLQILDKDLAGFVTSVAAAALLLESYWDQVHPRCQGDDASARMFAIGDLDAATVVFPLQYAPLFEARRINTVSYRTSMIAKGEVKPRGGEAKVAPAALLEARGDADQTALAVTRKYIGMLKVAVNRIREAFAVHGTSAGFETLPALIEKIQGFVDPAALEVESPAQNEAEPGAVDDAGGAQQESGVSRPVAMGAPTSLEAAREALAAVSEYYSQREPSSPILPLVRQAHQLIGKSFIEVIGILVPGHMEKAAFQIGGDQVFELPVGKLGSLPQVSGPSGAELAAVAPEAGATTPRYDVRTRSQAIALIEQVQSYFRHSEPASPVPMICDRARALAERDFMAVLRDVLPKAALKNVGAEK